MACNPEHKNRIAGLLLYSLVISLYSPETHPTWLPIFTACQPLKALATYSSVVPGATEGMREFSKQL
jgi:hypothetical protein